MISNFSFLQSDWPDLHAEALRAEAAAMSDPRTACFYARRALELTVAWLFQAESGRGGSLRMPYKADLAAFLFEPSFQQLVGPMVHAKMDVVRKLGNNAVHKRAAGRTERGAGGLARAVSHRVLARAAVRAQRCGAASASVAVPR